MKKNKNLPGEWTTWSLDIGVGAALEALTSETAPVTALGRALQALQTRVTLKKTTTTTTTKQYQTYNQ